MDWQELTYRRVLEDDVEISKVSGQVRHPAGGSAGDRDDRRAILLCAAADPRQLVIWRAATPGSLTPPPPTVPRLSPPAIWMGASLNLSPNGNFLIFTRKSTKPADQEINTLWAVRTDGSKPFSTGISNVVHFADWIPSTNSIAYSTVEPRSTAPGWQANNDLHRYSISTGEKAKNPGCKQRRRVWLVGHDLRLLVRGTSGLCAPGWNWPGGPGWKISQALTGHYPAKHPQ